MLARPALCLVTDRKRCAEGDLVGAVEAAVKGGVTMVQVREKDLPAGDLYRLVVQIKAVAQHVPVVVNDRLDVALAAGAVGVHLPEAGLPVEVARSLAPPGFLIGRSVHDAAAAAAAERAGADYVILGTIFETVSKPGALPAGLGLIREARVACRLPVIAIGGISEQNAGSAIQAGADGVAVVSAILSSVDPAGEAARLLALLRSAE